MDFKDTIQQIRERIEKLKDNLHTEEATKNALIMPFLGALGYDVFNPLEVVPELNCDIGTKKGEKIDYAIMMDEKPMILIECKHWQQNLNLHDNQLLRYFNVSPAKFGVLTNGIIYRFYTDLAAPNKMDERPFLEINLLDIKDSQIEELKKFHKSYFDVDVILSSASELKYVGELKTLITNEFANPSAEFVKFFGKQIYDGMFNAKVLDQFTELVKRSIASHISDKISDRLNAAIKVGEDNTTPAESEEIPVVEDKNRIVTTDEELEAYRIVQAILRPRISVKRITYRDAISYFSILLDDNNRKLICRIYLNSPSNKKITFMDENKKEQHNKIEHIDDIYNYVDQINEALSRYLN